MASCQIRCLNCKTIFDSPIQFGSADAFFSTMLEGNIVTCTNCRKITGCNKENMIFHAPNEGFVGSDT